MKKTFLSISAILVLLACTGKKKSTASGNSVPDADAQLKAAVSRYPDATAESIMRGHDLYFGTCTRCHAAKDITSESADAWPSIVDRMAKKAKITDQEKQSVLHYVMG